MEQGGKESLLGAPEYRAAFRACADTHTGDKRHTHTHLQEDHDVGGANAAKESLGGLRGVENPRVVLGVEKVDEKEKDRGRRQHRLGTRGDGAGREDPECANDGSHGAQQGLGERALIAALRAVQGRKMKDVLNATDRKNRDIWSPSPGFTLKPKSNPDNLSTRDLLYCCGRSALTAVGYASIWGRLKKGSGAYLLVSIMTRQ